MMKLTFFPVRATAIKHSHTRLSRVNTWNAKIRNISYTQVHSNSLNLPKNLPHLKNLADFEAHGHVSLKHTSNKALAKDTSENVNFFDCEVQFSLGEKDNWQDIMHHIEKNPGQYLLLTDLLYRSDDSKPSGVTFDSTGHIVYYHSTSNILIGKTGGKVIPEFGTFTPINQNDTYPGLSNSLSLLKAEYEHDLPKLLQSWQDAKKTVTIRYIGAATPEFAKNAIVVKSELQINQIYCLRTCSRTESFNSEIEAESRKEELMELFRQYKVPPQNYYLSMQKTDKGTWELVIQIAKDNCCAAVRSAVSGINVHDWQFPMEFDHHETTPRQELKEISRHLSISQYQYGKFFEYNKACQKQALEKFTEWVAVNKSEEDNSNTPKLGM